MGRGVKPLTQMVLVKMGGGSGADRQTAPRRASQLRGCAMTATQAMAASEHHSSLEAA